MIVYFYVISFKLSIGQVLNDSTSLSGGMTMKNNKKTKKFFTAEEISKMAVKEKCLPKVVGRKLSKGERKILRQTRWWYKI